MDGEIERIDPDEFSLWLTPLQAIAQTNLSPQLAVEKLLTDLRFGLVRAAARVSSWYESDGEHRGEYDPIPETMWTLHHDAGRFDGAQWGGGGDFWKTGNMAFYRNDGSPLAAIGVKFEPASLPDHQVAAVAEEVPEASAAVGPQRVRRADLKAWVAAYGQQHSKAAFREIYDKACSHFTARQPSQQNVKDAIAANGMTKSRGNPAITRK